MAVWLSSDTIDSTNHNETTRHRGVHVLLVKANPLDRKSLSTSTFMKVYRKESNAAGSNRAAAKITITLGALLSGRHPSIRDEMQVCRHVRGQEKSFDTTFVLHSLSKKHTFEITNSCVHWYETRQEIIHKLQTAFLSSRLLYDTKCKSKTQMNFAMM
jgi:hypothetical protein